MSNQFVISDKNAEAMGRGIKVGGFSARLFLYFFLYLFVLGIYSLFLISLASPNHSGSSIPDNDIVDFIYIFLFMFVPPMLPFILMEWRIRAWRRKHGFGLYKNIEEDIKQLAVDQSIAREVKAREKLEVKDLSYYHNLLKEGAITKEDYNKKKEELL